MDAVSIVILSSSIVILSGAILIYYLVNGIFERIQKLFGRIETNLFANKLRMGWIENQDMFTLSLWDHDGTRYWYFENSDSRFKTACEAIDAKIAGKE